ncbi:beta-ketoacyl synthase N-terminal-like domain-containing protein [Myxacorys almedinensis]|uniref:AMP-binding protein n=1 Tax=Myxacorys almedinensis A TaxID=2690445 RepID=A0A8J7Z8M7_9CYAN|nr:beta-ketoacyl synthase N-terminal-like domain-containing protein [Myxacorys almedinensis]NDJ18418.1 AMP-binding protein [Myxacorys almedinensis A]
MSAFLNSSPNLLEASFVDIVRSRAIHQPHQIAYGFLVDGETEEIRITYQDFDRRVRAIAAQLQSLNSSGSRALLLYPPGLDFIAAFVACLFANVIAVPAYPPRRNQHLNRLQAILADSQATIALTTSSIRSGVDHWFSDAPELAALRWLATDTISDQHAEDWQPTPISRNTLAFLQYTSGSTATPKGVMVSHGNLLHNSACIQRAFGLSSSSVSVTWLPSFHDMGLIDGILQPMYSGFPGYLMPPVSFLQRPIRWLEAISRYRATHSGGPNFAYDLCSRKVTPEQRKTLDLSSWWTAYNGAEPIRSETLQQFAETFKSSSFQAKFLYPCYGLAEATLMVSGKGLQDAPTTCTVEAESIAQNYIREVSTSDRTARTLVSSGRAVLDTTIAIVHPDTRTRCVPDQVGEIWVASPSIAQGYWQRAEETDRTFQAYLEDTGEGPFLRTGDLGFLREGQLFVTGRLKDLIVIGGVNYYPQDLEQTVETSHPALRPGAGAAFSVEMAGEERLAIAHELERSYLRNADLDAVISTIRQAVAEQHDLTVEVVLLLKTGSIPKTSSGKIQRHACRKEFLAGSLHPVHQWTLNPGNKTVNSFTQPLTAVPRSLTSPQPAQPVATIQHWLVARLAQTLQLEPSEIEVDQPFAYYGLASREAVGLIAELEDWLGCRLAPTLAYDYPSIAALSDYLSGERVDARTVQQSSAMPHSATDAIAIVGMSCRFPGASNLDEFWQLLQNGIDAIAEVPSTRWNAGDFYDPNSDAVGKMNTRWGGFLHHVDQFDPHFFGISPREAARIDPQHRLLMEVAWEALEDAGYAPEQLAGSQTGVFVGIASSDYSQQQFSCPDAIDAYAGTGNAHSMAANRLSYLLDLRGPSLAVDTACSASLVAVHLASQSLHSQDCDVAIVGGVNLILNPQLTIALSKANMMAPDGRCKPFDAAANGYVRSAGCGVVVLKRLTEARREGDRVLAILRGSAVNEDGRSNGLTAPNGLAQQSVIRQALVRAGVEPAQISYVEAHGTGTSLGDPIEVESLKAVLLQARSANQGCAIGSVKANIGHLEAAAGIAGLIKTVLALQHRQILPQLHLHQINPLIALQSTPFSIPTSLQSWNVESGNRFAGVSSFGFGGTNAHVVLEEASVEVTVSKKAEEQNNLAGLERPLQVS